MARLLSILLISTLLTFGHSSRDDDDDNQAKIENMGLSQIFSGGQILLKCTIPDERFVGTILWLKNRLSIGEGPILEITPAEVEDAGSYSCKGMIVTILDNVYTPESLPITIFVSGGRVLIIVEEFFLEGQTLKAKCLVRDNPRVSNMILMKNHSVIMVRSDGKTEFEIPNVNRTQEGHYSCVANWMEDGRAVAARSQETFVKIKAVVTAPVLIVESGILPNTITLYCLFETNKPDPGPQAHVYFYRNGKKLQGTARPEDVPKIIVLDGPGCYYCKVRIPALNLYLWSHGTQHGNPKVHCDRA